MVMFKILNIRKKNTEREQPLEIASLVLLCLIKYSLLLVLGAPPSRTYNHVRHVPGSMIYNTCTM